MTWIHGKLPVGLRAVCRIDQVAKISAVIPTDREVAVMAKTTNRPCYFYAGARLFLIAMALTYLPAVQASKPENITRGEIALLPPYCGDTMGFGYGDAFTNTSPRAGQWIARLGAKSFWALHHYCWGLIDQRRAQFISVRSPMRVGTLERAIANHIYTIKHGANDFVLLPEIYTRIGEAELMLSRLPAAYEAFRMAWEIKPDYPVPYIRWAEVLIRSGQKADAKKLIQTGLEHSPEDKELGDQFKALGGDPLTIVPIPKKKSSPPDALPAESEAPK